MLIPCRDIGALVELIRKTAQSLPEGRRVRVCVLPEGPQTIPLTL